MNDVRKTSAVLTGLSVVFALLAVAFVRDPWGHHHPPPDNTLVDPDVTNTAPARMSAAEVIRTGGDASGQDCYACHDRDVQVKLKFNPDQSIINAAEHMDIVMGHGTHNRNNNCFNCHDETNLELLQTRDGREMKLVDSTPLCGGCHGPTYRDWDAGVHGRTSGYWQRLAGEFNRLACVSCHDPHTPRFPKRAPTPGPNPLRQAKSPDRGRASTESH